MKIMSLLRSVANPIAKGSEGLAFTRQAVIILVSCIVYPLWGMFYQMADRGFYDPIMGRIAVCSPTLLALLLYPFSGLSRRNFVFLYHTSIFVIATHFYFLVYMNDVTGYYRGGALILFVIAGYACLESRIRIFFHIYSITVLAAASNHLFGWNILSPRSESAILIYGLITIAIFVDIAEFGNIKLKEALRNEQDRAYQNRHFVLIGRMIGDVAHNLNSPLCGLLMNIDRFQRSERVKGLCASEDLESMKSAAEVMAQFVRSLADLGVGAKESDSRPITEIGSLIASVESTTRNMCDEHRADLCIESPQALAFVRGAEPELRIALQEIIGNSLNSLSQINSISKWVRLSWEIAGSSVRILVQDSSQDRAAKSVAAVRGSSSQKESGDGTSLRLATEIVSSFGGSVGWAANKSSAYVVITLPIVEPVFSSLEPPAA